MANWPTRRKGSIAVEVADFWCRTEACAKDTDLILVHSSQIVKEQI